MNMSWLSSKSWKRFNHEGDERLANDPFSDCSAGPPIFCLTVLTLTG